MLGRSVTFRPESIERRSQRGTLKNLTTPTLQVPIAPFGIYVVRMCLFYKWMDITIKPV